MKITDGHDVTCELGSEEAAPELGARIVVSGAVEAVWREEPTKTGFGGKGSTRKVRIKLDTAP